MKEEALKELTENVLQAIEKFITIVEDRHIFKFTIIEQGAILDITTLSVDSEGNRTINTVGWEL